MVGAARRRNCRLLAHDGSGGAQASLIAFDLLRLDGNDLRLRPIENREARSCGSSSASTEILFSEALAGEGAVLFPKACELGLEGIVSKRQGSFYKSGKSRNWLKTVNPDSVKARPPCRAPPQFPGGPQRVRGGRRRAGYNVRSSPRSRFTRAINSSSL